MEEKVHWQRLKQGDQTSFSWLYTYHWKSLYTYAVRTIGDKDESSDIIQELFVRLWEKHARLPDVDNPGGYLFIWLKRLILNHFKAEHITEKHLAIFQETLKDYYNAGTHISAEQDLEHHFLFCLQQLPERMRAVFYLHRIEDIPVPDIALRFDISEQTVRNQLALATKRLKAMLTVVIMMIDI